MRFEQPFMFHATKEALNDCVIAANSKIAYWYEYRNPFTTTQHRLAWINNKSCSTAHAPCSFQRSEASGKSRCAQVLAYQQEQLPRFPTP